MNELAAAEQRSLRSPKFPLEQQGFKWTAARRQGAILVAQDEFTNDEIAQKVGVTKRAVSKWKRQSVFREMVQRLTDRLGSAAERYAIGKRMRRVKNLNDRLERMHQVIRDRG